MAEAIQNPSRKKKGVSIGGDPNKQLEVLLKTHGTIIRSKNHIVYDLFGQIVVCAHTPSDHRGSANRLAQVKRLVREHMPMM